MVSLVGGYRCQLLIDGLSFRFVYEIIMSIIRQKKLEIGTGDTKSSMQTHLSAAASGTVDQGSSVSSGISSSRS